MTDDERAIRLTASLATLSAIETMGGADGARLGPALRTMRAELLDSLVELGQEPHPHDLEALAR